MKLINRLITLTSTAIIAMGCSNSATDTVEYGTLSLALDASSTVINEMNASVENIGDYNLELLKDGKTLLGPIKYSEISTWLFPVSSNYIMKAENSTADAALLANDGWGKDHIAGQSAPFSILPAQTTPVVISCTVKNAKLSFAYDPSFVSAFTDFQVVVYETSNEQRKLIFNDTANLAAPVAYFNVDEDPEITYVVSYKYNGQPKTAVKRLAIASAKWYRITLKAPAPQRATIANSEAVIVHHEIFTL